MEGVYLLFLLLHYDKARRRWPPAPRTRSVRTRAKLLYIYIYICVCIHICVYICIYIYIYVYIYIYTHVIICICMCMYVCMCMCVCIYIYIYIICAQQGGRKVLTPFVAGVGLWALCKPVQDSDSEFSVRRLTLVCRFWVSPEQKQQQKEC